MSKIQLNRKIINLDKQSVYIFLWWLSGHTGNFGLLMYLAFLKTFFFAFLWIYRRN